MTPERLQAQRLLTRLLVQGYRVLECKPDPVTGKESLNISGGPDTDMDPALTLIA